MNEQPTPDSEEQKKSAKKSEQPKKKENKPNLRADSSEVAPKSFFQGPGLFFLIMLIILGGVFFFSSDEGSESEIDFNFFIAQLEKDNIKEVVTIDRMIIGTFKSPPETPLRVGEKKIPEKSKGKKLKDDFRTLIPNNDFDKERVSKLLELKNTPRRAENPPDYSVWMTVIWFGILAFFFYMIWSMIRRTRNQMMGGGMLNGVMKSPAIRYEAEEKPITFDDVAGLEGVKRDMQEIVEFLKDPEKFQRLGARIPKGVLLMGPPGTGKTLLAKAIAGEADAPFFSINGSEFIQLFVGVGAGRVRDMFNTAKQAAPAILFIDEIDAIGRQRGTGLGGGHDEREQTLNQILSEMDGFGPSASVIVLAATNRPDVLDPALLRPGRFDRHIMVDRPTLNGRLQLFKVHSKHTPIAEDVDFGKLARGTVGLTGADIRNLVNEAALWATRNNKLIIHMEDFEHARDRVLMGARRDDVLSDQEKLVTAYHEAGHAIAAWYTEGADPVHKVTIIPRGRALGVTQLVPNEDRHNINEHEIAARLVMLLAGRTAEKILFDEYSAGAENDLSEATRLARRTITHWGMSERLGPVALHSDESQPFLGREMAHEHREFSEQTARIIDEEIAKTLHDAADRAKNLLVERREQLEALTKLLLEKEEVEHDEIAEIIGESINKPIAHEPENSSSSSSQTDSTASAAQSNTAADSDS